MVTTTGDCGRERGKPRYGGGAWQSVGRDRKTSMCDRLKSGRMMRFCSREFFVLNIYSNIVNQIRYNDIIYGTSNSFFMFK